MYRIIEVGCGGMGNPWVQNAIARGDCEIVALVDIVIEHALEYKEKYKLNCPVFDHIDKALAVVKADILFDTTTPDAHHEIRTKGLKAGMVVLGEKPLAASMDEGYDILKVADEMKINHAVMQNRRYLNSMKKMKDIVSNKELGDVGLLTAQFFIGAHFGGFRDLMDNVLILDMAVHTFDQARFVLGDSDPVSVYCHEFNLPGSWYKGNASAICVFEFSKGEVFVYSGSWSAEGMSTSWNADWRMVCEKGSVTCDGDSPPIIEKVKVQDGFFSQLEKENTAFNYDGRAGHEGCFDEMFDCIAKGEKCQTDCTDNIKTMSMVFGAIVSAKTGKKVMLG